MNKTTKPQHILVAGIPGSGKTTYCQWLEREKGFLHLNFDELIPGRGSERKLALLHRLCRADQIVQVLSEQGQPIAIDWGFPVENLSLVKLFKVNGIAIWWFDGDREAARESFVRRGTVPVEAFDAQMKSIEEHWHEIQGVFDDNIMYAVSAGPALTPPEYIYGGMFKRR